MPFRSKWGDFLTGAFSHAFLLESNVVFAFGRKRVTISNCEKEKRWRLLASQTGVILLATLLLFLSSYLISVPLWLGGIVGEENEETAFMAVFSFYRLLHRKRYWKAFMVRLWFPLFHPLICLEQLLWEGTLDTDKHMMNVSFYAAFMSACHLNRNQCCAKFNISYAKYILFLDIQYSFLSCTVAISCSWMKGKKLWTYFKCNVKWSVQQKWGKTAFVFTLFIKWFWFIWAGFEVFIYICLRFLSLPQYREMNGISFVALKLGKKKTLKNFTSNISFQ